METAPISTTVGPLKQRRESLCQCKRLAVLPEVHAMFFDGYPDKGVCAAGNGHDAAGFVFVLPHDLPGGLDFDFNPIVFSGRMPVGGSAHLTIREDDSYTLFGPLSRFRCD